MLKLLVLTDDPISYSHGTGAVLLKILQKQKDENIVHGYLHAVSKPIPTNSFIIPKAQDSPQESAKAILQQLRERDFHPDIIYSNFYGVTGLRILSSLFEQAADLPPVIQHFHDLRIEGDDDFLPLLRSIQHRIARLWVLTSRMAKRLEKEVDKPVEVFSSLCAAATTCFKTEHFDFGPGFKGVMLGNIWQASLVLDVRLAWRTLRQAMPGLGPLSWYSHPFSLESLKRSGQDIGSEIEHCGFAPDLAAVLKDADLAIVPFNQSDSPDNDYDRFSFPSRLSELTMAGLPVFALACPGTTIWEFIHKTGIGRCACPADAPGVSRTLEEFAFDREAREACGRRARELALVEFDQDVLSARYAAAFEATLKN